MVTHMRVVRGLTAGLIALLLAWSLPVMPQERQDGLDYWNGLEQETITTESGLQYKVIVMGKGRKPSLRSRVEVHYRGLLLNGAVFDTSYNSDEPVEFSLRQVIAGWTEGVGSMRAGGKRKLIIPSTLGYGPRGAAGVIPPNATLIFEVEVLSIR